MSVQISLGLQTDKAPGRYGELAAHAEELGFDGVSVFSDLWFQPSIVALLEMAERTKRIRLGCACWNPFLIHPVELTGMAAALYARTEGRAYLGIARGTWLDDLGVRPERPLGALREAIAVIRALWSGDTSGVPGRTFSLAPGVGLRTELPDAPLRVLVGSWGERGAALAGETADEIKIGGSANPAMVEVTRQRLAPGLERAGRPPGDVGVVLGAVTVVDRDGAAARAAARAQVAMYVDAIAAYDPTVTLPEGMLERVRESLAQGDAAAAGAWIPRDVLDRFAFSGSPDDIAEQAAGLIAAGVDRIEFGTPHGIDEREGIDLLGRAVLPALASLRTDTPES